MDPVALATAIGIPLACAMVGIGAYIGKHERSADRSTLVPMPAALPHERHSDEPVTWREHDALVKRFEQEEARQSHFRERVIGSLAEIKAKLKIGGNYGDRDS